MARTDDPKDLARVSGIVDAGYLARFVGEADTSLADMQKHVVVPRLKLIQALTETDLKEAFGEGSVIVRPGDALVVSKDETFTFNPRFFFEQFCKWSDRRDKESPAIMETSFDATSELARRCVDPAARYETYEGHEGKPVDKQFKYRFVQHLCFIGMIYGNNPLAGQEVTLQFDRGEFGTGRSFISRVSLRRVNIGEGQPLAKVPLWAQLWDFSPKYREKADKKWWGLDPSDSAQLVLPENELEEARLRHIELAEAHGKKLIVVSGQDKDEEVVAGADGTKF